MEKPPAMGPGVWRSDVGLLPWAHFDDDDPPLRRGGILLPLLVLRLRMATFITQRDLQTRLLLTPPLFLFAAADLFYDPRFEHGDENP